MLRRHRARLIVVAMFAVPAAIGYHFYDGPASDRRFLLGCLIAFGALLVTILELARMLRCPRCGADTGHFKAWPSSVACTPTIPAT